MTQVQRPGLDEAALLVIDVQETFKVLPRWPHRGNWTFETNVKRLVDIFHVAERPIIYVLHNDQEGPFRKDSPHYRIMDFLRRRADEPIVHKSTINAFTSTNLQPLLLERGIRRIVICGIQTEQCCETTTRVGADLGFDIDFVTEATLTFPIPKEANDYSGEVLPVEAVFERTEYALRRRFARIATVDDIASEMNLPSRG